MRLCAIFVIAALLFASVPAVAGGPGPAKPKIPFDQLATSSSLTDPAVIQAAMNGQSNPAAENARPRHWSHGGKVMTYIGVPVFVGGAAMLGYGLKNGDSNLGCSGNSCTSLSWTYTGAAWLATGSFLTVWGLTRRTNK
jgi:hypothetical protein